MTSGDIIKKIAKGKVKFVELNFTDIFGVGKTIEIPVSQVEGAFENGVWFDGSSIKGFARVMESDMYLKPDPKTYAVVHDSKDYKTARMFCDIYESNGRPLLVDPRTALKRCIDKFEKKGYHVKLGPEVEFYLLEKNQNGTYVTPEFDKHSYFDNPVEDLGSLVRKEVMDALGEYGISSERGHHEVGQGQHEIGFKYGDPLETADRVMTLKRVVKSVAQKRNLLATFMPKPFYGKAGSGMHVHFSVFDKDDKPLFYDNADQYHLSDFGKHFIAGIMSHVKETTAVLNPTINSYKRLVKGFEAPVYICWGDQNRSSLIRIPRYTEGRKSSARAELRSPDVASCPYMAFLSIIEAGMDGVEQELYLGKPTNDSVYNMSDEELSRSDIEILPRSLEEALGYLEKSAFMKHALGSDLFERYISGKKQELDDFKIKVTDWETDRYLKNS